MKTSIHILLLIILTVAFQTVYSQTPAFPSAEGYGKFSKGGRGGQVVFVENLDDYVAYNNLEPEIPGSLRWAVKQYSGQPLTVIFRVSGVIKLKPYIVSGKNMNDLRIQRTNLTIAGQTAPGEGITIRNSKVNLGGCTDLIVRNVRFRIGENAADSTFIPGGSMGCENALRAIFDHCVFGWSGEENITMYDNKFTTVQWSVMHEGLYDDGHGKGNRSYGGQCGGASATWHHNLFAHNYSRSPRLNGARTDNEVKVFIEFINNVNYNWGRQGAPYGGELYTGIPRSHTANFVGNYYKPGPGTDASRIFFNVGTLLAGANTPKWYVAGNIMEGTASYNTDNWNGFSVDYASTGLTRANIKSDSLLAPPLAIIYNGAWIGYQPYKINIQTAEAAYNSVVDKVGTIKRDSVERRIIREVKTGTSVFKASQGKWGIIDHSYNAEGYLAYPAAVAPDDNDRDGMADDWEAAHGLNSADASDRNWLTADGYTALEVYLNSLMGEVIQPVFFSAVENVLLNQVSISPTVVTDKIKVNAEIPLKSANIYTMTGEKISNTNLKNNNIVDVTKLIQGCYIIEIEKESNMKEIFRFLKK
ncbi:MAG TPA: T9SS type A sorting domain-containing protein [Paludibacter sp.]|nr:T9SS type A sorting domain-containing protein [Paludibacter sp.]